MFFIDPKFKGSKNRFDMSKFLEFDTSEVPDVLNSYMLDKVAELPYKGTYVISGEVARPDLLSESIYGKKKTQYWWILLIYNCILDIEDLVPGKRIKFPSLNSIEELYFSLQTRK